jgi:hypothetical protein
MSDYLGALKERLTAAVIPCYWIRLTSLIVPVPDISTEHGQRSPEDHV